MDSRNDWGATLRALRVSAGVSLMRMAAEGCFSAGYLSQVENNVRRATPKVLAAYGRVLGGDMDRRNVLAGLLAGAASPATMTAAILAAYEKVLDDSPGAGEWAQHAESYGRDYMTLSPAAIQSRLAGDLIVLQTRLASSAPPELWSAAAKLLTVHGKMLPSADESAALGWYRLAARAADRSGDLDTRVWVRGRAAITLAYKGTELATAATLAGHALALSGRPSIGSLNARLALAHCAAHQGDHPAALRLLGAAERVFDVAGSPDAEISDFAVPQWRFATFASMLLSRLGDPRAQAAQDQADATRPATLPRFATHIELHRALMLARAGDRHGGVAYARAALAKLPAGTVSLSLRTMMEEVERGG